MMNIILSTLRSGKDGAERRSIYCWSWPVMIGFFLVLYLSQCWLSISEQLLVEGKRCVRWISSYGWRRGENMATVFDSPFLSNRLRQIEERYEEPSTFGVCDCTSYSYLALSVVLFTVGTAITILALGDVAEGHVFSNFDHMWFVGPIFICSGLMVAVKCMLYLRRKSVIQMIFHQRQLFRVSKL